MPPTARARPRPEPAAPSAFTARARVRAAPAAPEVRPAASPMLSHYAQLMEEAKVYAEQHGLPAPNGARGDFGEVMFGGPTRPAEARDFTVWPSGYCVHTGYDSKGNNNRRLGRVCNLGGQTHVWKDRSGKLVYAGTALSHLDAMSLIDDRRSVQPVARKRASVKK